MTASFLTPLPLIQAPMAGVSTPELAAAVSNAGALGSLGIGASSPDQAQRMIRRTRELTDKPFNVNLFCHAPALRNTARESAWIERLRPEFMRFGAQPPCELHEIYRTFINNAGMLDVLLAERPAVVSFHFGLPDSAALLALNQVGIITLACATCVSEAELIASVGINFIVAQGEEAGGHRGIFDPQARDERLSTRELVRAIRRVTDVPVIAAGGMMDGEDIALALATGAVAAQLGTAFILCPESAADEGYRATLASERARRTVLTRTLSGRLARGIANRLTLLPDQQEMADYPVAYDLAKALHRIASQQNCQEYAAHWAGTGAQRARPMPAGRLVATLAEEIRSAQRQI
jgi:nitronate monooxygenase